MYLIKNMGKFYLTCIVTLLCVLSSKARKNVLFLVADDMRPEIDAYTNQVGGYYPNMHTPNLDDLYDKSLVMKNAYVQQSVCAPSRASFMTSRRPDTTHTYDLKSYWRIVGGNFTTLPQHFKENGYATGGIGKIYHPGASSGDDDPLSWSLPYLRGNKNHESADKSWEAIDDSLLVASPLVDQQVADFAIQRLNELAGDSLSGTQPFFLAVGFQKPHLPFVFPESILQYYPESNISVPDNKYVTQDLPVKAWGRYGELRSYGDMSHYTGMYNDTLTDTDITDLRRAYFASVTWVDSQIGRILDELKFLGLDNNTIISFIGDHGFLLGENAQWCKQSNFELAVRAPMMIHIPDRTECSIETEALVEFVDLFPTLVEAAGLPSMPQCGNNSADVALCTEGTSLLPLIVTPYSPVKTAAFSQTAQSDLMGYSMRTERYRYTEWIEFDFDNYVPNWAARRIKKELYDHYSDPEETINIVDSNRTLDGELSTQLRAGWLNSLI